MGGAWCSGTAGGLRKLSIHWTTVFPVPLPTPSVHEPRLLSWRGGVVMLDDIDVDLDANWDLGIIGNFDERAYC